MKSKTPAHSRSFTSRIVRPHDVNSTGTAHGGHILEWMDMAASICARRHSNRRVNTVAVKELDFIKPLQIGHVAKIVSSISRTFRTSMEVIVDVYDEDTMTESLTLSAHGIFLFVGLDETGKPASVPELVPETDSEKKLWNDAGRRREQRGQHKRETED
jgi:acyl-CoA hydrolase